ncbi:MAG: CBS domain-containing protein [Planctomycetaceae bacterium]|nr:CBS domain-containing protein [Planctomycetaceae bacterium]
MNVGMCMTRGVASIEPGESIGAAASLMIARHIRRLPVVERRADGPHVVGIVTSRDLFRASPVHVNPLGVMALENLQSDISVSDVMKHHPITTTPDAPIEEAAQTMSDHKIGGIPVVEKGLLVGIITESDIFRAFVEMLKSPSGSARITFSVAQGEDIFDVMHRLSVPRKVRVISLNTSLHHETPVCVVRVAEGDLDAFLDDVWRSGHQVKNVLRIT